MKQLIVFLAMISLGVMLFRIIVTDDDSMYKTAEKLWRYEIQNAEKDW